MYVNNMLCSWQFLRISQLLRPLNKGRLSEELVIHSLPLKKAWSTSSISIGYNMTEWLSVVATHLAVMSGNRVTDICLEFVAQWFVHWYSSHAEILNWMLDISQFSSLFSFSFDLH